MWGWAAGMALGSQLQLVHSFILSVHSVPKKHPEPSEVSKRQYQL